MTARSIPEILGWERADDYEVPSSWWAAAISGDGWTVDDLLAWLRERAQQIVIETIWSKADNFTVCAYANDNLVAFGDAPTLLAALEAAVRAVAGES